jgi:hypothetical protein
MKNISVNSLKNGDVLLFQSQGTCFGGCIRLCTKSKFSHVGMVLENPTYIDPKLNEGLYLLESGAEPFNDAEDNTNKLGVQIQKLVPVLKEYGANNIFTRKLNPFSNFSTKKMLGAHKIIHDKPYDLNIIDWVEALIDDKIPIFKKQTTKRFWCSALISYIYIKLGYLPENTQWSMISPENWNSKNTVLKFQNCNMGEVKKVIF